MKRSTEVHGRLSGLYRSQSAALLSRSRLNRLIDAAAYDVLTREAFPTSHELLGESITSAPEKSNLASPLRRFTGACPPTLFLHGEADPIVPVEQSVILHEKLLAAGVDSDLMRLAGYTHGDHRFNRGAPAERINAYLKNRATA